MDALLQPAASAKAVFVELIRLPAEQRDERLAALCGDDVALRRRVRDLLQAHADPATFLNDSPIYLSRNSADTIQLPSNDFIGTQIGNYKLLEQIGEGGMGLVYMAEQQRPVRRLVALKLVKPGMDSRQIIARFEAERQALAMMDHPHIAKVLDAGTSDAGRPYFVMELVRGLPITEFCDHKQLSVRERLELFIQVCQAVQHAHQKGIIHRDLKPTNVLVTMDDATPLPKIIDFGIAKALSPLPLGEGQGEGVHTGFSQLIGTPLYMSPEQAEMNLRGVDTRSDVYSLGVMLYELLTGTTPFDKETLKEAGFDEMRRIIREVEPPRPSDRVSTLAAETRSTISQRRSADPRRISLAFRGELDWIVMKSLEKDRGRRYESASALAADIQRYLSEEPVAACPPTTAYRLRKFAQRHRLALVAAAIVATALVLGIAVSTWQAVRAQWALQLADQRYLAKEQAEQRAQGEARRAVAAENDAAQRYQVAKEAVDTYLLRIEGDERLKGPGFADLRKRLLEAAVPFLERLSQWKAQGPAAEFSKAEALRQLAQLRQDLGEYNQSLRHWEESQRILRQLLAAAPTDRAYREKLAHVLVGIAAHHRLRNAHSELILPLEQEALQIREQLLQERPDAPGAQHELAMSLNNVALAGGDVAKTKEQLKTAIKIWEGLAERFPKDVGYREELVRTTHNLGHKYEQLTDAMADHERGLAISEQMAKESPESSRTQIFWANSHHHLASTYERNPEQLAKALEHRQRAVQVLQDFVNSHPQCPSDTKGMLASFLNELGILYKRMGQPEGAEQAYRENLRICAALAAEFSQVVQLQVTLAGAESNLGALLCQQTKDNEGIDLLKSARERLEKVQDQTGGDDRAGEYRAITLENLAWAYRRRGDMLAAEGQAKVAIKNLQLARALFRELLELNPDKNDYAIQLGGTLVNLGNAQFSLKRPDDALVFYTQAIETLEEVVQRQPSPPASPPTARRFLRNAYKGRSSTQVALADYQPAYEDIRRAIELDDESLPDYRPQQIAIQSQIDPAAAVQAIEDLIASGPAGEKYSLGARLYDLMLSGTQDPAKSRQYQRRLIELVQLAHTAGYYNTPQGLAELDGMDALEIGEEFGRVKAAIKSALKPQP